MSILLTRPLRAARIKSTLLHLLSLFWASLPLERGRRLAWRILFPFVTPEGALARFFIPPCGARVMYTISVQLKDGNFLEVAALEHRQEALRFAAELNSSWPQKYIVRDSCGNQIESALEPRESP
jgi:hypothetical protein